MTENEVRILLQKKINEDGRRVSQIAWSLECDASGINKVLAGERPPGRKLLKWLGLRRVAVYEPYGGSVTLPDTLKPSLPSTGR